MSSSETLQIQPVRANSLYPVACPIILPNGTTVGDQYSTCYWSTVEINVAVCCACMPSLRLLLVKIFPKLGGGSAGRSRSEAPIGLTLCPRRGVERAAAADAATDPSQKILYSRGFQVQYSDARGGPHGEGDGSSTAELVDRDVEVAKSGTWKAPRSHMSL